MAKKKKAEAKAPSEDQQVPVGRQDVFAVAGHQYRDNAESDPGYAFDTAKALDGEPVEHLAVAATTDGLFIEIDGNHYRLDVQLALALRRLLDQASVNLNH